MEKSFLIPISRRDFMKMAGMATVGVLAEGAIGGAVTVEAARKSGGTMTYAGKEIPVLFAVDVCVAGGGPHWRSGRYRCSLGAEKADCCQ
ncbi:hypothetical protein SELR_15210 [Selenomonas ruminantium subsp. lactilytica TAM6421]|uniref:Tat (Twin-arginine translocation) pathway signal sequence n=1 Tax=Selenomonas ruminantium subsp. lactilytica (strain NBRC 103574 / TAM6421) TaxID=927704 RepID=I0GR42_SELRL|nr:twin-arginine translocation signal domain-containing protein [Selenomonas ruminantium]BAL83229.1 hypothetical protein SELR_15210 [Selenomonas ruminantium subsp. lactilytica TAM6421]